MAAVRRHVPACGQCRRMGFMSTWTSRTPVANQAKRGGRVVSQEPPVYVSPTAGPPWDACISRCSSDLGRERWHQPEHALPSHEELASLESGELRTFRCVGDWQTPDLPSHGVRHRPPACPSVDHSLSRLPGGLQFRRRLGFARVGSLSPTPSSQPLVSLAGPRLGEQHTRPHAA